MSQASESTEPGPYPIVRLHPKRDERLRLGHPWVYSNEIVMDAGAKALVPGSVVALATASGEPLGLAYFNPHTLIAARLLTRDPAVAIDRAFYGQRLAAALHLRDRLYDAPYYRLIHAEADGLPATIVDRMGDVVVVQLNAAGPDRATDDIVGALSDLFHPRAILLKNDSPARQMEGLLPDLRLVAGTLEGPVELVENGARFRIHPLEGQKTGWFYDQRDNRTFVARFAQGARVLDAYCYGGGFGIACARAGATAVTMVDRSAGALEAATEAARLNDAADRCTTRQGDVFELLATMRDRVETFDIVIVDPPAFAKSRKDVPAALKGYRKLAKLAAALVSPGGILFVASCSHNADAGPFGEAVARGLADARRTGRILRQAGAGPDHPIHPMLPESDYLKSLTLALD